MLSNFREASHGARAAIEVPPVPLAAIRATANQSGTASPRRKRFAAALFAGFAFVAVAAAAEYLIGTHVSVSPTSAMRISSAERYRFKSHPSEKDILEAVRAANFPAVLPPWVPGNARPTLMAYGSSMIMLSYDLPGQSRRSDHMLWIVLVNPLTLDAAKVDPRARLRLILGGEAAKGNVIWRIGRQAVIVPHSTATTQELTHIKNAMEAQARTTNGTDSH